MIGVKKVLAKDSGREPVVIKLFTTWLVACGLWLVHTILMLKV